MLDPDGEFVMVAPGGIDHVFVIPSVPGVMVYVATPLAHTSAGPFIKGFTGEESTLTNKVKGLPVQELPKVSKTVMGIPEPKFEMKPEGGLFVE